MVRLLTWNIHAAVGPDGRYDLDRVIRLIAAHDPDIVALQEIDSRGRQLETVPIETLKRAIGAHSTQARLIRAPDGDYGHAVISRWPMFGVRHHDLSVAGREPRCAIEATVQTPSGRLHLVAAHLGLSVAERRAQAAILGALASGTDAAVGVALGDFNDWAWLRGIRRHLAQVLPERTRLRTFPSWCPLLRLDRIYCRPRGTLLASWTDRAGRAASDHLPLFADIRIEAPPRPA